MAAKRTKVITVKLDEQTKKRIKRLKSWLKLPESEIVARALDRHFFRESGLRAYQRTGPHVDVVDSRKRGKGRGRKGAKAGWLIRIT